MNRYHETEFAAMDSFKGTLLKYRPQQSYINKHSFWNKNEDDYIHWMLCYVNPSKRQEWVDFHCCLFLIIGGFYTGEFYIYSDLFLVGGLV